MPDTPFEAGFCDFCDCGGIIRDGRCLLCGKDEDSPNFFDDTSMITVGP